MLRHEPSSNRTGARKASVFVRSSRSLFEFENPPARLRPQVPVAPSHRQPPAPAQHPTASPPVSPPKPTKPKPAYDSLHPTAKRAVWTGAREGRERAGAAATTGHTVSGGLGHVLQGMAHSVLQRPAPVGPRSIAAKDPRRTARFESTHSDLSRLARIESIMGNITGLSNRTRWTRAS